MEWIVLHVAIVFLFGASLGSFLNVVALRWVAGKKPTGRSHCPHCGRTLRWWELMPVVSYVLLRARCARCSAWLSPQYVLVELAMGLLVVASVVPWAGSGRGGLDAVLMLILISLLVILFLIDLRTMLLPDEFVGALLAIVLLKLVVEWSLGLLPAISSQVQASAVGALIGAGTLGALWVVTRGKGIGLGDVKLMIPVGILVGPLGTATILFLAFMTGGLVGAYLLFRGRAQLKTAVPFGPFLIGATLAIIVFPALPTLFWGLLLGLPLA